MASPQKNNTNSDLNMLSSLDPTGLFTDPRNLGTENRTSILPIANLEEDTYQLPSYDVAANIPTPPMVGVSRGGSINHVLDSAAAVAYYADTIGFGAPTNPLSGRATGRIPIMTPGINFFMKTGMTCPNGAEMWEYFQGIPKGDGLGKGLQLIMAQMGLPALRGLAPGIIEDTKSALNPKPLFNATFGNIYPKCVLVSAPVGNQFGVIKDPFSSQSWITGVPDGYLGTIPFQERWVQKKDADDNPEFISREEFDKTAKDHTFDGKPIKNLKANLKAKLKEKFMDSKEEADKMSILLAIIFLSAAFGLACNRK
jgi:hypothetical protein